VRGCPITCNQKPVLKQKSPSNGGLGGRTEKTWDRKGVGAGSRNIFNRAEPNLGSFAVVVCEEGFEGVGKIQLDRD
jgi:hypothetical protein